MAPDPMAIAPAAISARPAVRMMPLESTAPESPAASANGTVKPSDMPMTMSRTVSESVKWRSVCEGSVAVGSSQTGHLGRRDCRDRTCRRGPGQENVEASITKRYFTPPPVVRS